MMYKKVLFAISHYDSVVSPSVHSKYVLNFNETGGATSQLSEAKIRVTIDVWVILLALSILIIPG